MVDIKKPGHGDINDRLKKVSLEAKEAFASELDFSAGSKLAKASLRVLEYLDKFKIGPAVLSVLLVFAFPEKSREKIWRGIKSAIRTNRGA